MKLVACLHVERVTPSDTISSNLDDSLNILFVDVKVADPVLTEEWASEGTVEPGGKHS